MQMKILLVDDDPAYLEVLKFFLERDGVFVTDAVTSAREALDVLAKRVGHEAVVSDFMMPDIDGLEFLKILRAQGIMIPFIMLTGRGREDVAIHALNSGADFYIPKGGDPKTQYPELVNMLTKSINQKRAELEVSESERFLSNIFDSIQDGISVLDANYNITSGERGHGTMVSSLVCLWLARNATKRITDDPSLVRFAQLSYTDAWRSPTGKSCQRSTKPEQ